MCSLYEGACMRAINNKVSINSYLGRVLLLLILIKAPRMRGLILILIFGISIGMLIYEKIL
jgi:hypothetical protein